MNVVKCFGNECIHLIKCFGNECIQSYVVMRGWVKSSATHYIGAKYSRRVIYQLPMSDISTSQNDKDRGQRRFCDDGSKQKRSTAERKGNRGQPREKDAIER